MCGFCAHRASAPPLWSRLFSEKTIEAATMWGNHRSALARGQTGKFRTGGFEVGSLSSWWIRNTIRCCVFTEAQYRAAGSKWAGEQRSFVELRQDFRERIPHGSMLRVAPTRSLLNRARREGSEVGRRGCRQCRRGGSPSRRRKKSGRDTGWWGLPAPRTWRITAERREGGSSQDRYAAAERPCSRVCGEASMGR